jgi:Na+/H+ antiporter NhaD/arsenite permease-like protein
MAAPPVILILPFVLLLGAMALAPVAAPHWWEKHYPKVALGLGAVTAGVYLFILRDAVSLEHSLHEYVSFIALVGSLYVVAGGIHIAVPIRATPLANAVFLFGGAVAANVLGTTGAAMLLIRPWIQMNQARIRAHHIAFFIFLVANIGGGLTPVGDPPLFLGYLQGVPFWWVARTGWVIWAAATALLLVVFFVLDTRAASRGRSSAGGGERSTSPRPAPPFAPQTAQNAAGEKRSQRSDESNSRGPAGSIGDWQFAGRPNLLFLGVILGAVFITRPAFVREGLMLAAAAGSWFTTKKSVHAENEFTFHPVIEVAVLFAGIFTTMIPALEWLNHGAARLLGQDPSPGTFYWGTGTLSAVLDNAPTYLGFLSALSGVAGTGQISDLLAQKAGHVLAISIGAVFFGAATYIGNGPNFMVKAIAEQRGVPMPSFMNFIIKFSVPFLAPVLIAIWLIFFRGAAPS